MNIEIEESKLSNDDGWVKKIPSLLRILGTSALLIGMYSFLIKGWESEQDLFRYLVMLGHTAALAAIGLASGHWLKESKGARLLLTLSLVSVTANFAVLGAFIFSNSSAIEIGQYPNYAEWTVESMKVASLTTLGALIVLLPVTYLGFITLARNVSKRLSILFILSNVTLLVPLREPMEIGIITLALTIVLVFSIKKIANTNIVSKTKEGLFALGLQLLPLLVLVGRTLWLHSSDIFLFTLIAIMMYFFLQQVTLLVSKKSVFIDALGFMTLISALAVAPLLYSTLQGIYLGFDIRALILTISTSVSAFMIYKIHANDYNSVVFRRISGLMVVVGAIMNMLLNVGLLATVLCIISGVVLLFIGYMNKLRYFFIFGFVLIILGLAQQVYELVYHFNFGSWMSMAAIGVIAIIIASLIESKGTVLLNQYSIWKDKFNQWES